MPLPAAVPVTLTAAGRKTLKKRARGAKTCWRDRLRAQIVLAAARGRDNARIAAGLGVTADTVRKWRGRFAERGLAAELTAQDLVSAPMSVTSLLRILAENPVKPWQYRSWIYPRDPDFAAKATVILDLYQGFYQGRPLGPGDRLLSFDAKPSIQARGRIHQTLPAAPGRPVLVEHEYVRHGALALLAGLDVHTGTVFASTPATTGIKPFMDLVGQVMARPEYKNAPRVFVIVDNGSDHRGQAAIDRLRKAHPNAIMIHTPVHASWLNQIEIFFSVIQKKVVSPNDFASLEHLSETLLAFTERYNRTAKPFNWKYTAADLTDLLRRISEREQTAATRQTDLAPAA